MWERLPGGDSAFGLRRLVTAFFLAAETRAAPVADDESGCVLPSERSAFARTNHRGLTPLISPPTHPDPFDFPDMTIALRSVRMRSATAKSCFRSSIHSPAVPPGERFNPPIARRTASLEAKATG